MHYFFIGILTNSLVVRFDGPLRGIAAHPLAPLLACAGLAICIALMPGFRRSAPPVHLDPLVALSVLLFTVLALHARGPFILLASGPMRRLG
jgi:hypothetical protein